MRWMLQQEAQRAAQPHPTVRCFHTAQVRPLQTRISQVQPDMHLCKTELSTV